MKYWDPFEQMKRMKSEMDRMWPSVMERGGGQTPAMDLADHENELVAVVDLPGVKKEDIHVHCTEDYLEVSAKSSEEKEEKKKNYFFSERSSASFHRGVSLPEKVRPEQAKSSFKNGVLEIRLPKKESGTKIKGHNIHVD